MDKFTISPLSDEEMDRLAELLDSEKMPEETLDISGLHGFLTAVIIGPHPFSPSHWLPKIFGETEVEVPQVFDDLDEVEEFTTLIMRFYNQIVGELRTENGYIPVLYHHTIDGKEYYIIEDWCFGFMRGVAISLDAWEPLLDSGEGEKLLTIPFLFGTWEGLETIRDVEDEVYEAAVWALPQTVYGIMDFWHDYFETNSHKIH